MKMEYTGRIVSSQLNQLNSGLYKTIENRSPSEVVILHEQQVKLKCERQAGAEGKESIT